MIMKCFMLATMTVICSSGDQYVTIKHFVIVGPWMYGNHKVALKGYLLTIKVLSFCKFTMKWSGWISDSYCSLKPLWSCMGEVVPARTSPTLHPPSPPTMLL